MATVRVDHGIDDLASDLAAIPARMVTKGSRVVRKNVNEGSRLTRRIAKAAAGPHGKDYFKRISGEMTGALEGEFGPWGPPKSRYVGVEGSAGAMRDLNKAADVIGPKFADDAGAMLDGLFW